MKFRILTIIFIGLLTSCGNAQKKDKQSENASAIQNADTVGMVTAEKIEEEKPQKYTSTKPTELENYFSVAYAQYPKIPKGLLEAIAYDRTEFKKVSPYREKDTNIIHYELYGLSNYRTKPDGYPEYYTDNLILKDYIKKSKIDLIDFLNDEKSQILFVATELIRLKKEKGIIGNKFKDFEYPFDKLFGYQPLAEGFKSYPGYITICRQMLKGFETNEVKVLPNRSLLNYYNSIRPIACLEEERTKEYDEK
jgi:hypothetical protein